VILTAKIEVDSGFGIVNGTFSELVFINPNQFSLIEPCFLQFEGERYEWSRLHGGGKTVVVALSLSELNDAYMIGIEKRGATVFKVSSVLRQRILDSQDCGELARKIIAFS
jgi:hypothetical protein